MTSNSGKYQIVLGAAAVAAAVALFACADNIAPHTNAQPVNQIAAVSTNANSVEVQTKINVAKAKYAWVGRLHKEAMEEAIAERRSWGKNPANLHERICQALSRLGKKYALKARVETGEKTDPDADERYVRAGLESTDCVSRQANIFASPNASTKFFFSVSMSTDDVQSYGADMVNRLAASDGYSGSYDAIIDDVLSSASNLPQEDFESLVALAVLAGSSTQTWYTEQQNGSFGEGQVYSIQSVFRGFYCWGPCAPARCNESCQHVVSDDCWGYLGGAPWGIEFGFILAAVASGHTAYNLM
jgi:hypothetical protein